MKNQTILRDERYYAVENASYKIGFNILTYGLFGLIIIRSLFFHQTNWDLFGLVIVASLAATIYQGVHKVLPFSWKKMILYMLVVALLSAVTTFLFVTLRK